MPVSRAVDLLDLAESLGLLVASDSSQLRDDWTNHGSVGAREAADQLIQRRLLTAFQAQRLLEGDGESLVVTGRYHIHELLGTGGMGAVFLAHDAKLGRNVALKVLPPRLVNDPGAVARFEREAKAMARLTHPNIVHAHDVGCADGQHYLVMEHVPGLSLADLLKQDGALPPARAADYGYQTALGLQHAHQKALVHRDLKPANLIITPAHEVKILDLGLARFLQDQLEDGTLTMEGTALGTPDYMAPEQFGHARHADERSDVYALGCTLYHSLAGRVPFPGSSFSEKQRAHQETEPEPVHRHAPGIPAGLSQAVAKMMAKRPADRFPSALACSEALLPYVDAASGSLPDMLCTTEWHGSQLRVIHGSSRRTRQYAWVAVGAALALVVVAVSFGIWRSMDRASSDNSAPVAEGNLPEQNANPPTAHDDAYVLTVSKSSNDGGQYRSITDALQAVQPGMTIRIVDGETYEEELNFLESRHVGICLEGLGTAAIKAPNESRILIAIQGIAGIRISDLILLQGDDAVVQGARYMIGVFGKAPGVTIERVRFQGNHRSVWFGVGTESLRLGPEDAPLTIENCVFSKLTAAARVSGATDPPFRPMPMGRVFINRNSISNCAAAFILTGQLQGVHVVGNNIDDCVLAGVLVGSPAPLFEGSSLLIANNTINVHTRAIVVEGPLAPKCDFQVRNNLLLVETGPDIALNGAADPSAMQTWKITDNVRRVPRPDSESSEGWLLSPTDSDLFVDDVPMEPGDPLIRIAADWAAGRDGAGRTEPSLPTYVGAVAPKGMNSWDWTRTWRAPPGTTTLLTVSQDPGDGGQYRTVAEALAAVAPWDTIRILDDHAYPESITLDDPTRLTGIALESEHGATVQGLTISNVPFFLIRGFRVKDTLNPNGAVIINGNVSGGVIDSMVIDDTRAGLDRRAGISVVGVELDSGDAPLVIRGCRISAGQGIGILGSVGRPTIGICLRDNRFHNCLEGIEFFGVVRQIHAVGNIVNAGQAAIELHSLAPESNGLLIANNTMFGALSLLRVTETDSQALPAQDQVELSGNLFFEAETVDMARLYLNAEGRFFPMPGEPLVNAWRFRNNWRDQSGVMMAHGLRLAEQDRAHHSWSFVSRDLSDPDYMRPLGDEFARGGAGGDLPEYVGAVPPAGVAPWDWNTTWRSRSTHYAGTLKTNTAEGGTETREGKSGSPAESGD